MSFTDCELAYGVRIVSLKDDGDKENLVFIDEPRPIRVEFNGESRVRSLFPVVTKDGLRRFLCGKRTTTYLKSKWSDIFMKPVTIVRHGEAGSPATTYEVVPLTRDDDGLKKLAEHARVHELEVFWTTQPVIDNKVGDSDDMPL